MEFKTSYEHLLQPGKIGKMELRNRMLMPGMGTNLNNCDGTVSDAFVAYHNRRAQGGVAMITTEVVAPEPNGRVITGELRLDHDKYKLGLSRIPHAAHAGGAKACLQLAHGGCHSSARVTGVQPKCPTDGVTSCDLPDVARAMTIDEIKEVVEQFGEAAERAKIAGFDAVELHGAHGYLLLQFLSGYTNKRTDEYGGSLENRARFALETIASVRRHVGEDFTIIYRLSGEEYVPGGVTIDEACKFAKMAEAAGVDAISVSAGTWNSRMDEYHAVKEGKKEVSDTGLINGVATAVWVPPQYSPRGTMIHLAAAVKRAVSIPVIASCGISPEVGEEIIARGDADFITIGRQIIADPDYPNKIKAGKPETVRRCLRCNECLGNVMNDKNISCSTNPEAGKESELFGKCWPAEKAKRVAIVGSGPAGMQAAITAAARGHDVTIYEAEGRLGGKLNYLSVPDFKQDYRNFRDYLVNAVEHSGAKIKLNTEITAGELAKAGFDSVIVAAGGTPIFPNIPGLHESRLLNPLKILSGEIPEGKKIVVCGAGLVGCEIALYLAEMGKQVVMVDRLPDIAPDMALLGYGKWVLDMKVALDGIEVHTKHDIVKVSSTSITCRNEQNEEVCFSGDAVVCALGLTPVRGLAEELREIAPEMEVVTAGDVNATRKVMQATHEGYHAARNL